MIVPPKVARKGSTTQYYSVEEALVASGFGLQQWFMMFTCGLYWSADAMQLMVASYLIPALEDEWELSPLESNLTAALVFLVGLKFQKKL